MLHLTLGSTANILHLGLGSQSRVTKLIGVLYSLRGLGSQLFNGQVVEGHSRWRIALRCGYRCGGLLDGQFLVVSAVSRFTRIALRIFLFFRTCHAPRLQIGNF